MNLARLLAPPRPLVLSGQPLTSVGRLRMYVCGVTPYDVTHVGHAATFVWADAAIRTLRWAGHTVTVARNVTDVDATLYQAAARRMIDPTMLAAVQRAAFENTMATLKVGAPEVNLTVAQAVGNVVQLAAALLDRDAAYIRDGSVYVRAGRAAALAGLDPDQARARAVEFRDFPDDPRKDDPFDVAVWQGNGEGALWPSPWGEGRPGWHAGCAAMVLSQFGPTVDIHAGGADLAFPHHAVETVMAEAATGVTPFARAWLRAGVVSIDAAKMAKSAGNLVLVDDLLRDWPPAVLRLLILNRPWAAGWSFSTAELDSTAGLLDDLYSAAAKPGGAAGSACAALLNDLDVPGALGVALDRGGASARELIDVLALT